MKKVALLVLLVLVTSTLLMAAIPTKMVRLTIINKSDPGVGSGDYTVYMKLTGSAVTDAFYYLVIPAGSQDAPTVRVFTIMQDVYDRETWQSDGLRSTGQLVVTGNIRLTFVPTGRFATVNTRAGEPTMEKVSYFKYLSSGRPIWNNSYLYDGYWNYGGFLYAWRIRTYKLPIGQYFRYQY